MIISPDQYKPGTIDKIPLVKRNAGNQRTKKRLNYKDIICTFDIETTRIPDIEQSIMYVWMLHLHTPVNLTVIGRWWYELDELLQQFVAELDESTLCIYVHNLSYEFQFSRAIYDYSPKEVFAVDRRKVLKCTAYDERLEFRCSYLHSNMSLAEFTDKMDVEHKKLSGDEFDYTIMRYPWTELKPREIEYCCNDVIGLAEAIAKEMEIDGDNLYTIPLTSTGYVRRDCKRAMRSSGTTVQTVKNQLPNYDVYEMLSEAFRGGDTHANRYYSDRIIKNVKSADIASSYPNVLCNCEFPMSAFYNAGPMDINRLLHLIEVRKKAVLMRISITKLRLKNQFWGFPYLSTAKCRRIEKGAFDNGRILSADYLETTITDIDLKILLNEYEWEDLCPFEVCYARYGKLPQQLIDVIISYFVKKTELKNVDGQEVLYMKSKNKINACYGMMAQRPVKQDIIFDDGEWKEDDKDPEEILNKSNTKAWLCYQWGVWCTAHARSFLHEGLHIAGDDAIYCDTDSVKYRGDADFTTFNNARIKASTESGAYAQDKKGKTYYMGVFEDDGFYPEFKTLGAKKYAFTKPGKTGTFVTIAGVTKRKGGAELDKHGGLSAFAPGFVFREAGGTEAVYNDNPENGEICIDGHTIKITPNICIRNSTYTLGITEEYRSLIENSCLPVDFWKVL